MSAPAPELSTALLMPLIPPVSSSSSSSSSNNTPVTTFRAYIVKPGQLGLQTGEWKKSVVTHDIPLNSNWIGTLIVDHLKRHPDDHILAVPTIGDNSVRVYQLCYTDQYKTTECKDTEQIDSNRNHLAEYLVPERRFIWGDVAIIAINEDGDKKPSDTFTQDELDYLVSHRELAMTIVAEPGQNGSLSEQTLTNAQIEKAIMESPDNSCAERQILGDDNGYNISAWRVAESNIPNWTASRILASRVTGTWAFAVKRAPETYTDLTSQEVIQLALVCAGATSIANLTAREVHGKDEYVTRYTLLRDRISCMVAKCQACKAVPEVAQWCGGCYRMRYCNAECRAKHWDEHKKDCSYNNPGLCAPHVAEKTPVEPPK